MSQHLDYPPTTPNHSLDSPFLAPQSGSAPPSPTISTYSMSSQQPFAASPPLGLSSSSSSFQAPPQTYPRAYPPGLSDSDIVHADQDCTVFRESKRALASRGHYTLLVHPPSLRSIYDFGPADVPKLVRLLSLSRRLLSEGGGASSSSEPQQQQEFPTNTWIGFVSSFRDPLNAPTLGLTLHAIQGPLDRASFWTRTTSFGPLGFYGLEDLIAEIREATSNNRVKSGYSSSLPPPRSLIPTPSSVLPTSSPQPPPGRAASMRKPRPLSMVPDAGAREGLPNGIEFGGAGGSSTRGPPSSPADVKGKGRAPAPAAVPEHDEDENDEMAGGSRSHPLIPTQQRVRSPGSAVDLVDVDVGAGGGGKEEEKEVNLGVSSSGGDPLGLEADGPEARKQVGV